MWGMNIHSTATKTRDDAPFIICNIREGKILDIAQEQSNARTEDVSLVFDLRRGRQRTSHRLTPPPWEPSGVPTPVGDRVGLARGGLGRRTTPLGFPDNFLGFSPEGGGGVGVSNRIG